MKIKYTQPASENIEAILHYIHERSPQGANRLSKRMVELETLLLNFPFSGTQTRLSWLRRLVIAPYPYLMFYEVTDDIITIHTVIHSTRDISKMPDYS